MATKNTVFSPEDSGLEPISPDQKRGWQVFVNDQKIEQVSHVVIKSSKGTLTYGWNPMGWDQWNFEEPGGGGSILLPYFIDTNGNLMVGLAWETRPFESERSEVLNAPRIFMDPAETHFQASERLAHLETGYVPPEGRIHSLSATGKNPNSTFFITNKSDEHGCRFFGLPMIMEEIDFSGSRPKIKKGEIIPQSKPGQKVMKCSFYPYEEVEVSDMFTHTAISLLEKFLIKKHNVKVQFG